MGGELNFNAREEHTFNCKCEVREPFDLPEPLLPTTTVSVMLQLVNRFLYLLSSAPECVTKRERRRNNAVCASLHPYYDVFSESSTLIHSKHNPADWQTFHGVVSHVFSRSSTLIVGETVHGIDVQRGTKVIRA